MKIGIIGSAVVGQVLSKAFRNEGHDVMLGTRDTSKQEVVNFKNENTGINVGTFQDTAKFGETIVLATGGSVIESAIRLAGVEHFSNKIVIDVTNPIAHEPPVNGILQYFTSFSESLMERIQRLIPEAKLVKAFNSVSNVLMYKPKLPATPTMFICGNDDAAKKTVANILSSFGWETKDIGKVEAARAIEPLALVIVALGLLQNDWMHAFKLLKP